MFILAHMEMPGITQERNVSKCIKQRTYFAKANIAKQAYLKIDFLILIFNWCLSYKGLDWSKILSKWPTLDQSWFSLESWITK